MNRVSVTADRLPALTVLRRRDTDRGTERPPGSEELGSAGLAESDDVERAFEAAMIAIYATAKRDLGYNAKRFLQMITDHGGLAAARKLLHASAVSEGFTTLWERRRLDLSVEAHVLRPEYESLFTDSERRIAERRLKDYGFDGDIEDR